MTAEPDLRSSFSSPVLVLDKILPGNDLLVQESSYNQLSSAAGLADSSTEPVTNKNCPCPPRRLAEEELARKIEELARSNQELEQFAFVASHDLQEPLRMVAAYTQLLAERYRGRLDPDADRYIAYACEGALRLQSLIQDLLSFSRVGFSGAPCERVDVNCSLQTALQNLAPAIAESNATIHASSLPTIWMSRSQLIQVFQNLIGNAIKFRNKERPFISVEAARQDQHWLFSVSDNGIGIEQAHADALFVIFQRLHTRGEYPGNGIGLAICKRIIERFGGRIWFESHPGSGSTFKFTLPSFDERSAGNETMATHSPRR